MKSRGLMAWLGGGLAAVIAMGCGGMEVDDPVARDGNGSAGEEVVESEVETVEHGGEASGEGDPQGDEAPEREVVESEDCQKLCFQAQWCQERGEDLEGCLEACEGGGFEGLIAAPTMACFDEAISCTGMARCTDDIEVCAQVCETMGCEESCRQRCGEAVLGGGSTEALELCLEEDRGCEALGFCSDERRRG